MPKKPWHILQKREYRTPIKDTEPSGFCLYSIGCFVIWSSVLTSRQFPHLKPSNFGMPVSKTGTATTTTGAASTTGATSGTSTAESPALSASPTSFLLSYGITRCQILICHTCLLFTISYSLLYEIVLQMVI